MHDARHLSRLFVPIERTFSYRLSLSSSPRRLLPVKEMDDEAETYKLWRVRKTVMQVSSDARDSMDLTGGLMGRDLHSYAMTADTW